MFSFCAAAKPCYAKLSTCGVANSAYSIASTEEIAAAGNICTSAVALAQPPLPNERPCTEAGEWATISTLTANPPLIGYHVLGVAEHFALALQVSPRAAASDAISDADKLKGPPNLLWRVASAMMYLIPWIDSIAIGREIYHNFPASLAIYFLPGAPTRLPACPRWPPCRT